MRTAKTIPLLALLAFFICGADEAVSAPSMQDVLRQRLAQEQMARAKAGDGFSQVQLAKEYLNAPGNIATNKAAAHRWFQAAATNNMAEAQWYFGEFFLNQAVSVRGVTPSDKARRSQFASVSLAWHTKAAKQGHFESLLILGQQYEIGTVYGRDLVEAYRWYSLAIEKPGMGSRAPRSDLERIAAALTPEKIELAKQRAQTFAKSPAEPKKPTAPK